MAAMNTVPLLLSFILFVASGEQLPASRDYLLDQPQPREAGGGRFGNFRCYTGTGNGIQAPTLCPSYSTGCVKRTSTLRNGNYEVQRFCGDLERSDVEYKYGCDSFDVPHEMEICYCNTELCNSSTRGLGNWVGIISGTAMAIVAMKVFVKI